MPRQMPRYGILFSRAKRTACDLAFDAALAEAARHEDRVHAVSACGAVLLDVGGLDVVDVHARARLHAGVASAPRSARCSESLICTYLPTIAMSTWPSGIRLRGDHLLPLGEIGGRHVEAQLVDHDVVEALLVQQHRDLVDVVGVDRRR